MGAVGAWKVSGRWREGSRVEHTREEDCESQCPRGPLSLGFSWPIGRFWSLRQ
jgi:hypothetical protein